jgi:hypothetical protein
MMKDDAGEPEGLSAADEQLLRGLTERALGATLPTVRPRRRLAQPGVRTEGSPS